MAKDPLIARLQSFRGRRVLITGHTGFKGAWLTLWLLELGAEVIGIALDPPTQPNLFDAIDVGSNIADLRHDIRETDALEKIFRATQPEIVFHLAAQPLVRPSYSLARETFDINVMGTVSVLDVVRKTESVRVVIHVGTDKVYENFDQNRPFSETDPLGGHDPYSASKAAVEIVFQSFVRSFYRVAGRPFAASGRAGNVLGGGDWAKDRIVPDAVRALAEKRPIPVRNPDSTRPWQHVLEALSGYLTLAARLMSRDERAVGSWNFGPPKSNVKTVRELVESLIASWGGGRGSMNPMPIQVTKRNSWRCHVKRPNGSWTGIHDGTLRKQLIVLPDGTRDTSTVAPRESFALRTSWIICRARHEASDH